VIQKLTIEEIIDQYQDRVYNTCLGFLKNPDEAKDMAQEVFILVFKNLGKFKGDAAYSTWIYRIAVNACLEHVRNSKRKKRSASLVQIDSNAEREMTINSFYHPGVELENKERSVILFHAIDQLPELQKTAFTLHKVEGLSYEEIGKIMKKSLSSVESLMHRAKQNLRIKLKHYYEDQEQD